MIRLTELQCSDGRAVLRLEGTLTQDAFNVLNDTLKAYTRRHITRIQLDADGLTSIDRVAVQRWRDSLPSVPELFFHTSRTVLKNLLEDANLTVVLSAPA